MSAPPDGAPPAATTASIPGPAHLSAGARAYLSEPDVLDYPIDWTDRDAVQRFRGTVHPVWCLLNDDLDFDYEVTVGRVGSVPVERVRAGNTRPGACILHFHGGMYCVGTPEMDRVMNAPLARAAGVEVVSVEYRLAPEHPFPAAVDDAERVYRALVGDGLRVAVYGESAGGGLAAALAVAMLDRGGPAPVALGLISPMLDLTGSSDTYRTLASVDPDYYDPNVLLAPGAAYAAGAPLDGPLLSPLFADLSGLPPTLVLVGGREVLLGDSIRFARAARAAGVFVELDVLDGGWHNYPLWYGVPEADEARDRLAAFLGEALK